MTRNSTIDEVYRQYLEQNRLLERVLVHVDRANQRVTPLIKVLKVAHSTSNEHPQTSSTVADYGLISTSELIAVFNQPARAWREKKGQKTLRQVPLEQRESSSASFNRVFQVSSSAKCKCPTQWARTVSRVKNVSRGLGDNFATGTTLLDDLPSFH